MSAQAQRAKEERAARRAATAPDPTTYKEIEENPTVTEWAVTESQADRYRYIFSHFEGFLAYQEAANELEMFPAGIKQALDFFPKGAFLLDYPCLEAFIRYYAGGADGSVSLSGLPLKSTVLSFWGSVYSFVYWKTGAYMEIILFEQVRQYIETDLETCVGGSKRKITWLLRDDIMDLAKTYLDVNFTATTIDARVNMLAWQATTVQSSVRRSALVKSEKKRSDQKYIQWGAAEIRIVLPPDPTALPALYIYFVTPNSKSEASAHSEILLESCPDVWEDPVHHLLLIASLHGAFPAGWTYELMYDRDLVQQRAPYGLGGQRLDTVVIKFNPAKADEPIFQSPSPYRSVKDGLHPWTSKQFYSNMRHASDRLGFDSNASPHVLRRSGVASMKVAGATNSEITQQLRHKWGGYTFQSYTGRLIATDVTAVVWKAQSALNAILAQHQDRIKRNRVPPLPRNVLMSIIQDPIVADLIDKADDGVKKYIKQCSISCQADWDKWPAELEHVRKLCDVARQAYNARLHLQRQRFYGKTTGCPKPPAASSIEGGGDEQVAYVYDQEKLQNYTAAADDYEEGIDTFPAGQEIGFNLSAFEQFISETDLNSSADAFSNALDVVGDDLKLQLLQSNAAITDELIDPVLLALSHKGEQHEGIADPSTDSPVTHPVAVPPIVEAEIASLKHLTDARDHSAAGTALLTEFNPFENIHKLYFIDNDRFGAFKAILELPGDYASCFSFRPNHAPDNGRCRFCNGTIEDVARIAMESDRPLSKSELSRLTHHVNSCAARSYTDREVPNLLERYSNRVTYHHILGKKMIPKKKPGKLGGPDLVFNLKTNIQQLIRKCDKRSETLRCQTCLEKPSIYSLEHAEEHLLMKHGVWLGPISHSVQTRADRAAGIWNQVTAGFPSAPYSTHDGRYHPDPLEYAKFCETMLNERLFQDTQHITAYGPRLDIIIPPELLAEFDTTLACDTKYDEVRGRGRLVVVDGLCIFCANNTHMPYTGRAEPRCDRANCLHQALSGIQGHLDDPAKIPPSHLWDGARITCPDPVCMRGETTFGDILQLTWHIVAIHNLNIREHRKPGTTIMDISFTTLQDIQLWARDDSHRHKEYKRKRSASIASTSTSGSPTGGDGLGNIDEGNEDQEGKDDLPGGSQEVGQPDKKKKANK